MDRSTTIIHFCLLLLALFSSSVQSCQWSEWTISNYKCGWYNNNCRVFEVRSCSCKSAAALCGSASTIKVSKYECDRQRCKHILKYSEWESWTVWSNGCPSYRQRVQRCQLYPEYTNSSSIVDQCKSTELMDENESSESCSNSQLGMKIGISLAAVCSVLIVIVIVVVVYLRKCRSDDRQRILNSRSSSLAVDQPVNTPSSCHFTRNNNYDYGQTNQQISANTPTGTEHPYANTDTLAMNYRLTNQSADNNHSLSHNQTGQNAVPNNETSNVYESMNNADSDMTLTIHNPTSMNSIYDTPEQFNHSISVNSDNSFSQT